MSTELIPISRANECERLYTVLEAAGLLAVSKHYVYERITSGAIQTVNLGDGRAKTRVAASDLQAFIDSRKEVA